MKKILVILFLSSVLFSCKKDYFCECVYYNDQGVVAATKEEKAGFYKNSEKSEAETKCKSMNFEPNTISVNGRKCTLK